MDGLRESLTLYLRPRILVVLLLGFSSGLPLALSFATLSAWLTEIDVTLTTIGVFTLVGTPYTLKFLWAPLIDRAPVPVLTARLGRRRGWMVTSQIMLIGAILFLGQSTPGVTPVLAAVAALAVAFCSATQDIVIDAYRVEILEENEQGAGAAVLVFGYRVGLLVSGAGALFLADRLPWPTVYGIMAGFVLVGMITALLAPEPKAVTFAVAPSGDRLARASAWLTSAVVEPFREFTGRRGWFLVLAFILLYKLGDAFAGVMTTPFYIQIGFTKTEIAEISKVFGLAAVLIGGFIGGLMVNRMTLLMALLVCGVLQAGSNLMFAVLASAGADLGLLTATIAIENVTGGMGTAAFVAYLSSLCNTAFTATQYALLSSFMAVGRTFLASSGGWVAERTGWVDFFVVSTVVALPGLLLLVFLARRPELSGKPMLKTPAVGPLA
ncbi:MAG: AmpG family muropeptide MFS transporter [Alphaproteobacteria bacterium]|nr:AmpG family muropeptide MFS transporter [Alphaproteobacteria bacterium]